MKKVLLASACLFALAAPASAADLAARPYTKAPIAPAAVYNWTGFYLGIVGGGAWEASSGDPKMQGGFVGGTAGYNWQTGNVVFGIEADGAWADVSASAAGTVFVAGVGGIPASVSSKTDAMATATPPTCTSTGSSPRSRGRSVTGSRGRSNSPASNSRNTSR